MQMPNDPRPTAFAERAAQHLQRLVQVLDEPLEAFLGEAPFKSDAAEAAELLRLWHAIQDPENRQSLLLAARGLVDREADARLAAE
ncbi:hypothetical protein FV228_01235 [Methylobacterium sp. WL18]|uniref:hypothetical protein n=1 Tax=Methylobacterium sp. WL18 TaxID=2603897 RepID=UPI0011C7F7B8|nr:hypothetical protein [Methylobacterium sp. WL18]TXN76150.1 hypothetical protein FV228_01235 [Methylobacterium sp. WL18]